ncbi:hypothetical protein F5Y16DRAFT_379336 [Xylariaceae sp. FL0255]|nr:hypothetical protein F5Y16DRAFT_379336 [Xylariaceae sp. FL0255]
MDSFRSDQIEQSNSFHPRSVVDSVNTVLQRQLLHPTDAPDTHHRQYIREPSFQTASPQFRLDSFTRGSTNYPTTLAPLLEQAGGISDVEIGNEQIQSGHRPQLEQGLTGRTLPRSIPSLSPPNLSKNMSAATVSYDPRMDMGIPRSSYSWSGLPGLESSPELLSHEISNVGHHTDISNLTPPHSGSRSMTGSPPKPILTPEQRELKRQVDQARRGSKTTARVRRAMSNTSFSSAGHSPPLSMHEFPAASPMPVYTTAPTQISLLAEPVTTVGQSYMPSYSTSPLPDHANSHMYTPHYSPVPSNDYMGMNYTPAFPPPTAQNLPSQYSSRASSLSEPGIMYPVQPPVLPSGNPQGADGGHVRVVQSRPKPQCWEHGCNGRQFSTFSNLLRHQREKSGQAAKATCPNCGAEFTRTTARNGHLLHDKCKQRRNS